MNKITLEQFQENTDEILDLVQTSGPIVITSEGQKDVVLVGYDEYTSKLLLMIDFLKSMQLTEPLDESGITMTDAARFLNVNLRYLINLVVDKQIESITRDGVASLSFESVVNYKKARDQERRSRIEQIVKISEGSGLYDGVEE